MWTFSTEYVREVEQRVNRPLAETHWRAIWRRYLDGGLDTPAARQAVGHVQALHPALDLYLLDAEGEHRAGVQANGRRRPGATSIWGRSVPSWRIGRSAPHLGRRPRRARRGARCSRRPRSPTRGGGRATSTPSCAGCRTWSRPTPSASRTWPGRSRCRSPSSWGSARAGGLVLFTLVTRRFRRLAATVERFSAGDHAVRAPEEGDDEIGMLGQTFNAMADRIETHVAALDHADEARRALAENVAHDFRNLLAPTRTAAERLLDAGRGAGAGRPSGGAPLDPGEHRPPGSTRRPARPALRPRREARHCAAGAVLGGRAGPGRGAPVPARGRAPGRPAGGGDDGDAHAGPRRHRLGRAGALEPDRERAQAHAARRRGARRGRALPRGVCGWRCRTPASGSRPPRSRS